MVSIAFTGGGSGGHIYPGLAIITWLKKQNFSRIFWIGSNKEMDRVIVARAGIDFYGIPSGKLRRYFSLQNFVDIFRIAAGFFASLKILLKERPALLFSKGGFASVPPCMAAKFMRIPVFTHESDFSPGLATMINARFAEKIFIPYKESASFFAKKIREKTCVSGNPVRPEFAGADPVKGRIFLGFGDRERVLLVLGGSQGSHEINTIIKACLPELTKYYTVVHQTGDLGDEPQERIEHYEPYAFFHDEIPHVIAAAELVICRSGANTIWECKSLNKPMILIPLRGSGTRGDQVENARLFEEAGAAVCLTNEKTDAALPEKLSALVASLADDPDRRKAMGEAKIIESNAASFIAGEIERRIGGGNE